MKIAVLVPTYQRPIDFERCLQALQRQTRAADRVFIVARPDDAASHAVLDKMSGLPIIRVPVHLPGQVAALNAGLSALESDIGAVAITDDDAAPRPDWLAQIEQHFLSDPRIGAVGGRDVVHQNGGVIEGAGRRVGLVQWFGRTIGNHHLGSGGARDVDLLKGANMSYRVTAITGVKFDTRLRGAGAQVANDMRFSLSVRQRGWRVVYDPAVTVDHYPAQRHDNDRRGQFNETALVNAAHNETLALLEYLPSMRRYAFMVWALASGDRALPGLLQWVRLSLMGAHSASARFRSAVKGRLEGWKTWRCSAP